MITTEGVVLARRNQLDNDVSLTILTKKFGKITAYAKGAQSPRSRLNKGIAPFTYGEYDISGTKDYKVSAVEVKESFYTLREHTDKLFLASYFNQLVDTNVDYGQNNKYLYEVFIKTLYFMTYSDVDMTILKNYFEIHLIKSLGLMPKIDSCMKCGKATSAGSLAYLDISSGGVVCSECMVDGDNALRISPTLLKYFEFISKVDYYTFVKKEINGLLAEKMDIILNRYLEYYLGISKLKSYKFMKGEV